MGYMGKLDLKKTARKLRQKGLSVRTIQKELQVSKSSISLWTRDIVLTEKQLEVLFLNKKTGIRKASIIAARNKIKRRKEITQTLLKEGELEIGKLSKRDKFIAGLALYFAEGDKTDKNVAFTNTDPRAIKFMCMWFRIFCKIAEDKFRCYLYIHDDLNELDAKRYWSLITKIPLSQFRKSYIVKNRLNRLRKTKHKYGVLRITISNVSLLRKIMGWISGVFRV